VPLETYIKLRKGRVASTVELRPGLLFGLDKNGEILDIEVLSIAEPWRVIYAAARKLGIVQQNQAVIVLRVTKPSAPPPSSIKRNKLKLVTQQTYGN